MLGDEDITKPDHEVPADFGYRFDLKYAVGVMITTPFHSVDETGSILWGDANLPLGESAEFVTEFMTDMESIFTEAVDLHLGESVTPNRKRFSHKYFQPPAAQGWPEIALWLWDNALPALGAFDVLVSTGKTIREVKKQVEDWFNAKALEVRADINTDRQPAELEKITRAFDPQITLTPLDVAALTSADANERFGMRDVTRVTVFTRSPVGMGGADHPGPMNTYLSKIEEPGRTFVYITDSSGKIIENFLMASSPITPLPIANSANNSWASTEVDHPLVLAFDD